MRCREATATGIELAGPLWSCSHLQTLLAWYRRLPVSSSAYTRGELVGGHATSTSTRRSHRISRGVAGALTLGLRLPLVIVSLLRSLFWRFGAALVVARVSLAEVAGVPDWLAGVLLRGSTTTWAA